MRTITDNEKQTKQCEIEWTSSPEYKIQLLDLIQVILSIDINFIAIEYVTPCCLPRLRNEHSSVFLMFE